jgi:hypothetical protein
MAASPSAPSVPVVAVHFHDAADFRQRYHVGEERDHIFLPEALDHPVAQRLLLDFYFDDSGYAFRVAAVVISRRLTTGGPLKPGVRVELAAPEEAPLRKMIVAHATGQAIEYRPRAGPRVPCRFPVRIRAAKTARGQVVDLSIGGARVIGIVPPPLGSVIEAQLYPPGKWLGIVVSARVVWERATPDGILDPMPDAMLGIEFQVERPATQRRLEDVVARLSGSRLHTMG